MRVNQLEYTGIIEPGAYCLNDFVATQGRLRDRGPFNKTVYIHVPTNAVWSAEMIDTVFPPTASDFDQPATVVVHVNTRLTFKRSGSAT